MIDVLSGAFSAFFGVMNPDSFFGSSVMLVMAFASIGLVVKVVLSLIRG